MEKVMEYITKFFEIVAQVLALFGIGQSDVEADEEPAE